MDVICRDGPESQPFVRWLAKTRQEATRRPSTPILVYPAQQARPRATRPIRFPFYVYVTLGSHHIGTTDCSRHGGNLPRLQSDACCRCWQPSVWSQRVTRVPRNRPPLLVCPTAIVSRFAAADRRWLGWRCSTLAVTRTRRTVMCCVFTRQPDHGGNHGPFSRSSPRDHVVHRCQKRQAFYHITFVRHFAKHRGASPTPTHRRQFSDGVRTCVGARFVRARTRVCVRRVARPKCHRLWPSTTVSRYSASVS
jgi:hypothetical protein